MSFCGTEKHAPSVFAGSGGMMMRMMTVQGVSREHVIYWDAEDPAKWYYLNAPTDGPVDWLVNWAQSEQTYLVWICEDPNDAMKHLNTMQSALTYCLTAATDEIKKEML